MGRINHESCWCVWEIEVKSNSTNDQDVFHKIILMSDEEIWRNTLREHNFDNEEEAKEFFNSKEIEPHYSYPSEISGHTIYVYNGLVFAFTEWGTYEDTHKQAYSNTTIIDCFVNTLDKTSNLQECKDETETDTETQENDKQGE